MSDTGEKNDKRPRNEDSIPTADCGDSTVEQSGQESVPTASSGDSAVGRGGQVGPGEQVGVYKLLSKLGEGGFAEVYLAEQQKPVKRRVALKVIKPGMDSAQVIARFEAERQALALLDHPNIAQVYDAGTTAAGRPYFVVEHVKGVSLTEHCDREKLSIEERLGLFGQVCDAIQHAHQKGIIHRDIKPSNILVSFEDQRALPKVIDFGIAKAITQPLTERTLFTVQGQLIGTPEYMSPEQAEMTAQDIDTRSDIYSLGVLLYELLTGTLPFDQETLERAGYAEILRIIREEDPARPSTRLSSLGEEATKIAQSRRTEVAKLTKRLHKELEWIPLKAMRKERTHRYRSASELADDIQNYLNGVPLIAGPESAAYRIRKFVRRNRVFVTAAAAVAAVIVVGLVVSTALYFRAEGLRIEADQAGEAEAQQRQIAEAERDRAEQEAERAKEEAYVNRFFMAKMAYEDNDMSKVRELLLSCPADSRCWEWYRLWRMSDQTLLTLSGGVGAPSFTADGKWVASGGALRFSNVQPGDKEDNVMRLQPLVVVGAWSPWGGGNHTIKFWNAQTGIETASVALPVGGFVVAFSPDGKQVARVLPDVRRKRGAQMNVYYRVRYPVPIKIWDFEKGEEVITGKSYVSSVVFSPDGGWVVSGTHYGNIRVWDAATGAGLRTLSGHNGRVNYASFSPDGGTIVSGGNDKTVRLWDARSGAELKVFRGHSGPVTCVAFAPDGWRVVSGDAAFGAVRVWDVEKGTEVKTLVHRGGVRFVSFSPDGQRIVSDGVDPTIKVWETKKWTEVMTLREHTPSRRETISSPSGLNVPLLDPKNVTLSSRFAENAKELGTISSISFSSDGTRMVSNSATGIKVWDLTTDPEAMTVKAVEVGPFIGGSPIPMAVSPNGRLIVSGGGVGILSRGGGKIRIWDGETGVELMTLRGHRSWVDFVSFSPDGKRLISGSIHSLYMDRTIKVWDVETWTEVVNIEGVEASASFSPDSKRIVSGGKPVKIWDAETGEEITTLQEATGPASFSPDGKLIMSFGPEDKQRTIFGYVLPSSRESGPKTIKIWDAESGTELAAFEEVRSASFSPDGKRLAIAGETVKMWDLENGTELMTLAHGEEVRIVCFSPDSTRIVAGSETLKVWDAETGTELSTLVGDEIAFNSASFSPDGKRIVTTGSMGVKVWNAVVGAELMTLPCDPGTVDAVFSRDGRRIIARRPGSSNPNRNMPDTAGKPDGRPGTATIWEAASAEEAAAETPIDYVLPTGGGTKELLAFLEQLKEFRPGSPEQAAKARKALTDAAKRILQLEKGISHRKRIWLPRGCFWKSVCTR